MYIRALFAWVILLATLSLGACAPSEIPIPTIDPPDIGLTIVMEENTPANGEPSATIAASTPAPEASGDQAADEGFMMLIYIALAMAGVALLLALFGLMRRPDA